MTGPHTADARAQVMNIGCPSPLLLPTSMTQQNKRYADPKKARPRFSRVRESRFIVMGGCAIPPQCRTQVRGKALLDCAEITRRLQGGGGC